MKSLHIKNYKIFREVFHKDIPNMAVFLGANGSGKSTLFDVFGFLHDALIDNVRAAITKRGGYKEVVSRGEKGPIEFEIKFRPKPLLKQRMDELFCNSRTVLLRILL